MTKYILTFGTGGFGDFREHTRTMEANDKTDVELMLMFMEERYECWQIEHDKIRIPLMEMVNSHHKSKKENKYIVDDSLYKAYDAFNKKYPRTDYEPPFESFEDVEIWTLQEWFDDNIIDPVTHEKD